MALDPSILVTLLNPLEADDFMSSRERDPANRRHVVNLHAASQRHFDSAMRAQRAAEGALFAGLDEDQRRQLSAVPVVLRDSLASGHEDVCSLPEV
jgi:DNA-binding MarR family transcriptional regulator